MPRPTSPLRRRANKTKNTSSFMNYYTANYTRLKALCIEKIGSVSNTIISRYATDEWRLLSEAEKKTYSMNDVCFFDGRSKPEPEPEAKKQQPDPEPEPETKEAQPDPEPEPETKEPQPDREPEPETKKSEPKPQIKSKVEVKNPQPKLVPNTFKPASKSKADSEVTFIPVGK